MAATAPPSSRVPVICIDPASVIGADIFNPNSWSAGSKGLVQSCWVELSVLHHCVSQITDMCKNSQELCHNQILDLQQQWATAKFDLDRVILLGEQPDLHLRIEAFFSGVKSLLDLLVQLLSTERIVSASIDGFHRNKQVYGGKVLNALKNNSPRNSVAKANTIAALIVEHKSNWIDQLIDSRDLLIHPKAGMRQLMFHFDCEEKLGVLVCNQINPPVVGSVPIDLYTQNTLQQAISFSSAFVALVQRPMPKGGRD